MSEENIKRIKKFFLDSFIIDETRIDEHLKHDLMIRLDMVKADINKKLIIYFACLDCKEKWKHSIFGKRSHLLRICSTIHFFFSHQIQMTQYNFGTYRLDKEKYMLIEINNDEKYKLIEITDDDEIDSIDEFEEVEKLPEKFKKRKIKNIKGLLNKYNEKEVEDIEDKGYFSLKPKKIIECEICKNFDSKKLFCDIYNCFPLTHKIPVEEYCNEFTLDKIKEGKEKESLKLTWDAKWEGNELQPNRVTRIESEDTENKDYSKITIVENSEKSRANTKGNYILMEEDEDLDNFDIVYAHNNKKLGDNDDPLRNKGLITEKTRKEKD